MQGLGLFRTFKTPILGQTFAWRVPITSDWNTKYNTAFSFEKAGWFNFTSKQDKRNLSWWQAYLLELAVPSGEPALACCLSFACCSSSWCRSAKIFGMFFVTDSHWSPAQVTAVVTDYEVTAFGSVTDNHVTSNHKFSFEKSLFRHCIRDWP